MKSTIFGNESGIFRVQTKFDFLIPDTSKELTKQKPVKGKNSRFTLIQLGQLVYAIFFSSRVVVTCKSVSSCWKVMYKLKLENVQKIVWRHLNQIHIVRDLTNAPNRNVTLNPSTPGNLSVPRPHYQSCACSALNRYGTYICYWLIKSGWRTVVFVYWICISYVQTTLQ